MDYHLSTDVLSLAHQIAVPAVLPCLLVGLGKLTRPAYCRQAKSANVCAFEMGDGVLEATGNRGKSSDKAARTDEDER
nr:MAG TPA: hypothetical protein [Caudoviricetes sp.]